MQKPNLLKYTDYMSECCRNLRQTYELSSDVIISRLIALRRLDDQIHDAFFTEDAVELPITDPRIVMNYRFLQTQIDDSREENCSEELQRGAQSHQKFILLLSNSFEVIGLTSTFTSVQLHAISLRTPQESTKPDVHNSMQLNALLATLEACKRHLDLLLTVSASEYHLLSFSEWMRLPFVLITAARTCLPSDYLAAIQWDVKTAQERLGLDKYLESLCSRTAAVSVSQFDFWNIMNMIMRELRIWYLKKIEPGSSSATKSTWNGIPTPNATHSSLSNGTSTPSHTEGSGCPVDHGGQLPADMDLDMLNGEDALAFMRSNDFDMDTFFDMGLWGDETYTDMGFGGGSRF